MGKKGARIVSISPGVIMTPMSKKALEEHPEVMKATLDNTPLKKYGEPEDVANAVEFLLSKKANFITGTDLIVDGGIVGSMPSAY
jgi:NAD(P)-dependent dehydrogenase (short-subunit alcohol dehydrogenase family)